MVGDFQVLEHRTRWHDYDRGVTINVDPKTGIEVEIAPGKTVRFKPGKELREL